MSPVAEASLAKVNSDEIIPVEEILPSRFMHLKLKFSFFYQIRLYFNLSFLYETIFFGWIVPTLQIECVNEVFLVKQFQIS